MNVTITINFKLFPMNIKELNFVKNLMVKQIKKIQHTLKEA